MNNGSKQLVEMYYYRDNQKDNIRSAIVTEKQAYDIKVLLSHIRVIKVNPAPKWKERDYVLM